MRFNANWLTALALAVSALLIGPAQAQPGGTLAVAWTVDGNVGTWHEGDPAPQTISVGDAIAPYLSPDGSRVAFTGGREFLPSALWLAEPGGEPRQVMSGGALDGALIAQAAWQDNDTLVFSSTLLAGPLGANPQDDLYQLDVNSGALNQLRAAGQGGAFAISPDGAYIATVYAGAFDEAGNPTADGQIRVMARDGADERTLHTFTPIATGSPNRYYPELYWLPDSSGLYVAIPPADIVLSGGETALWRLPLAGEAAKIGMVDTPYFQPPKWSADRTLLTYGDTPTLANADASSPTALAEAALFGPFRWAQMGSSFVYASGPASLVVGNREDPAAQTVDAAAIRYHRVDDTRLLVVIVDNTQLVLQIRDLATGTSLELARGGFESDILFDTRILD